MAAALSTFCPAKINAFLAVTGRRGDGFHDLVSLVLPLEFGDELTWQPGGADLAMTCSDAALEVGPGNLVLKAAAAFERETGEVVRGRFHLAKRVPTGAGLGGGSSDAAGALLLLNRSVSKPLSHATLSEIGARVGSDVPLFLTPGPSVIRGRGERVEALAASAARSFSRASILLFKPDFGVPTPWAYGALASGAPATYCGSPEAESRLAALVAAGPRWGAHLFNSFEAVVFARFIALPTLLARLRTKHGAEVAMSGSGSCCFAVGLEGEALDAAEREVRECWGPSAFVARTRVSGFV